MHKGHKSLHRAESMLNLLLPWLAVLHRVVCDERVNAHDRHFVGDLASELLVLPRVREEHAGVAGLPPPVARRRLDHVDNFVGVDAEHDPVRLDQSLVARLSQDVRKRVSVSVAVLLWQSELSEQQVGPRESPISVLFERIGQLARDAGPVLVRERHVSMIAQSCCTAV